jgi:hypothetical protein
MRPLLQAVGVMVVILASWAVGIAVYVLALAVLYHQRIGRGDLIPILYSAALPSLVAIVVVDLPVLLVLRRAVGGRPATALFALAAALLGIVPTSIVVLYHGGSLRQLASPEARLFLYMFSAMGMVFGAGFARIVETPRPWRGGRT